MTPSIEGVWATRGVWARSHLQVAQDGEVPDRSCGFHLFLRHLEDCALGMGQVTYCSCYHWHSWGTHIHQIISNPSTKNWPFGNHSGRRWRPSLLDAGENPCVTMCHLDMMYWLVENDSASVSYPNQNHGNPKYSNKHQQSKSISILESHWWPFAVLQYS